VLLGGDVAVSHRVIEVHGVAEARAAARLDGHPQDDVGLPLLLEELLDLARGGFGERDHRPHYSGRTDSVPG
jgi:hypothetical protein